MKVLHLLESPKFSGAENVVCQIINLFKDNSEYKMVYCSRNGEIRNALSERKVAFYPIKNLTINEVKKAINDIKPDIIHAHDMRASFIAAVACGNIPLISHIHNNAIDSRGVSIKSIAYLYAGVKAKHIFWVSRSSFDGYNYNQLLKKKSSILYNIIDINKLYLKMQEDKHSYDYDVIYLGRLTSPKNPYRLLDVFKLLIERNPDIKIAVVGTGNMEDEIKEKAKAMNLIDNVVFKGYQDNPLKMLHESKIMIMTSLWEGTPMCALEAAALGTPVVSTPVDGLKDLIVNDKNGYLSDDNETLADIIIDYIGNAKKLNTLSSNQILAAKEWNDKEKYYNEVLITYKRALVK